MPQIMQILHLCCQFHEKKEIQKSILTKSGISLHSEENIVPFYTEWLFTIRIQLTGLLKVVKITKLLMLQPDNHATLI